MVEYHTDAESNNMTDQPHPVPSSNVIPEIEDPDVTDAQLGAIVRRFQGMVRPPMPIVVRPSWFEKTVVVLGFLLVGVIVASIVIQYQATLTNREVGKDVIHVLCDPKRIPEIVNADAETQRICGEVP